MKEFDAIIIGSGQAGNPLAKSLAKAGWKTAIIEREHIGGTCINTGCTPTKTMIASARAAYIIANGNTFGIDVESYKVNIDVILKRKNEIVKQFQESTYKGLKELENISVFLGEATFVDKKQIEINLEAGGKEVITANTIFINSGAHTSIPDIKGLTDSTYYTSSTIMNLEEVPEHLIVIGGGYIGLEFGQMYKRFGSKVTIIEPSDRILNKEDKDITDEITKFLKEEDIEIITQAKVTEIKSQEAKHLKVVIDTSAGEKTIQGSHLLIATGRTPNTKDLNLNLTAVDLDERGHVVVNEKLETSCSGIYALGDVKGGPQFTHIAYNDYVIVSKNLLDKGNESTHNRVVPYCMFTDPQLGRVGITEAEARKKNMNIKVATLPMKYVARGIESGNILGMMKVIVDVETSQLLGAAIIGEIGGEIMTILQVAMIGKITYHQLRYMVFAHPLYAEAINNLFIQFDDQ